MRQVTADDMKLRILDAMRRMQNGKSMDTWYTMNDIDKATSGRYEAKKDALWAMVSEGWLHVRHAPDMPERLFYRLKSEYC